MICGRNVAVSKQSKKQFIFHRSKVRQITAQILLNLFFSIKLMRQLFPLNEVNQ